MIMQCIANLTQHGLLSIISYPMHTHGIINSCFLSVSELQIENDHFLLTVARRDTCNLAKFESANFLNCLMFVSD